MRHSYPGAKIILAGLSMVLFFMFAATPAVAETSHTDILVGELLPRAAETGFSDLVISKARGLGKLSDAVIVISALLSRGASPADSRYLYAELASIQELQGRYEDAAQSWEAAVAAQAGKGELSWLLSAAACRLATGDAETAAALAKAAILTTSKPGLVALAMLIEARALLMSGDVPGALARAVDTLAIESSGLDSAALALAMDASSGTERESYLKRLRDQYSDRPEVHDGSVLVYALGQLVPVQTMNSVTPIGDYSGKDVPGSLAVDHKDSPPASGNTPAATGSSAAATGSSAAASFAGPLYYQLGAFRDEANAELLSSRLVRAGFQPKTAMRKSGTGFLAIVYLEAGPDPARIMVALKDAGFESWPLFAAP